MTIFGAWARRARSVSFQANSRAEGGAFILSLQTGVLGKKADERIKADYNRVGRRERKKMQSIQSFLPDAPGPTPAALRKRRRCWLENCRIKLLTVATASFDPQLRMPC